MIAERVEYLDENGKLITESLRDFTKKALRRRFVSLDQFKELSKASGHTCPDVSFFVTALYHVHRVVGCSCRVMVLTEVEQPRHALAPRFHQRLRYPR